MTQIGAEVYEMWLWRDVVYCFRGVICNCRAVAALAESPDFHMSKRLQPGDIEIVHNPTIFHSRGEVVDGEVSLTSPSWQSCAHVM